MRSLAARRLAAAPLLAVLAPTVLAAAPLTVHGTALTPAGAPLAGARAELLPVPGNCEMGRLRLAGGEPAPAAAATTDALGGYALAAPGPGVYAVRLRAAGAVPLQSVPLPLVEDLELPPATPPPDAGAALLVRDAAGAARRSLGPRRRAPVGGGWRPAPRVGRTSADGSLSLPRAAGEALTVRVFTAVGREEVRADWTGGAIALAPQPAPARRLRVRDVQGRPVPDVLVRAGEALWPIGLTGADGGLDVPATAPRVLLVAPDGRQQPASLGRAGDPVVLADAVPLAGSVVAAETKQSLASAFLWSAAEPSAAGHRRRRPLRRRSDHRRRSRSRSQHPSSYRSRPSRRPRTSRRASSPPWRCSAPPRCPRASGRCRPRRRGGLYRRLVPPQPQAARERRR